MDCNVQVIGAIAQEMSVGIGIMPLQMVHRQLSPVDTCHLCVSQPV